MLKYFKKTYSDKEIELFDFQRKNPLLETLTDDELSKFQAYIYTRTYKENEVVFFTGDPSHALYIVRKGVVSLNLEIKGEFEKLMILRNGGVFGDNSILEKTKRIYTAIVLTDGAELMVIPKVNLVEIMEHNQTIKAKMMYSFAKMYNNYTIKLFETYKSSRGFFDLNTVYS
ncbi:MAG: CRP/FNR family cyclic AMP-dependent transcriptional regulator [Cyclobacteriaceae bacterium]|jgi:CRP/FNR family cyclic AMP-dependent transcriptional regulator